MPARLTEERICYGCGSNKTERRKDKYPAWCVNGNTGLFLCSRCYSKYITNVGRKYSQEEWALMRLAKQREIANRVCSICGTTKTKLDSEGRPRWCHDDKENVVCKRCYDSKIYRNKKRLCCYSCSATESRAWYHNGDAGQVLCKKCYSRYIINPKNRGHYMVRRFLFHGQECYTNEPVRTGICSLCERSVARGEIKRTNLHHKEYDEADPLAHTVELCVGCHSKIHWDIYRAKVAVEENNEEGLNANYRKEKSRVPQAVLVKEE